MTTKEIKKAAGIIIQDRKLLVERSINKEHFIAPGGTMEPGETPIQTLIRELKEEFQIDVEEPDLVEFGMFKADAAGLDNTTVTMHVYMVKNYLGNITPSTQSKLCEPLYSVDCINERENDLYVAAIFSTTTPLGEFKSYVSESALKYYLVSSQAIYP